MPLFFDGAGGAVSVDDDGTEVVAAASRLNFGNNLTVADDGGGAVTIDGVGGGSGAFASMGVAFVADFHTTTSDTFTTLTSAGPSVGFTVPSGETWSVDAWWAVAMKTTAGGGSAWCVARLDSDVPSVFDWAAQTELTGFHTATAFRRFTGITAGAHTISLLYRRSGSATAEFGRRRLRLERVA